LALLGICEFREHRHSPGRFVCVCVCVCVCRKLKLRVYLDTEMTF